MDNDPKDSKKVVKIKVLKISSYEKKPRTKGNTQIKK